MIVCGDADQNVTFEFQPDSHFRFDIQSFPARFDALGCDAIPNLTGAHREARQIEAQIDGGSMTPRQIEAQIDGHGYPRQLSGQDDHVVRYP